MPRFVILRHDQPVLHWDLMLEAGAVLWTWRLASEPLPGKAIPAERIGDHRLDYLTYEGPVSANRGNVRRWDAGSYLPALDPAAAAARSWTLEFCGNRLRGVATLGLDAQGRWSFQMQARADG